MNVSCFQIRDFPQELIKRLRVHAILNSPENRPSLTPYVIEAVQDWLNKQETKKPNTKR